MADIQAQLQDLTKRRDAVRDQQSRLRGRLESAQKDKQNVEAECLAKGVAPDNLDATISELERRFDILLKEVSDKIANSESSLAPYIGG